MLRISIRDRLFLFTTISGTLFIYTLSECPVLEFHELGSMFPAMTAASSSPFQDQRGFFNVLRWIESLHTPQDLEALIQMMKQSAGTAGRSVADPSDSPSTSNSSSSSSSYFGFTTGSRLGSIATPFHTRVAEIAAFEMHVHVTKMLLQCGLVLFLYRLKMMPRRRAMQTICLCVLVLLCWKMAQTCLQEILSSRSPSAAASSNTETQDDATELRAAFLSTLFLLRYAGMALVNFIMGRAYQLYLCDPWPETWKRIPQYLGSKNLVVSTLYFASGCVAVMSFSCAPLRSLSEAALQIENVALASSLAHFVFFRLVREKQKQT